MELVDTHCHIQSIGDDTGEYHTRELWRKLDADLNNVIVGANSASVTSLICVGCDPIDSRLAISCAHDRVGCYASIGIHPHEAKRFVDNEPAKTSFADLINSDKVVAVGECGLDYYYNHSRADDQASILRFQLDLAAETGLPVIFHVRQAFADFWPIFDSYKGKLTGVLHSFTDSQDTLQAALDRGLFIGVNGIVTFAKDPHQLSMYTSIPLNQLLLETDAPYLTPVPYRGNINEPKHILTIAEFLADLRGNEVEAIAKASTANAKLLFGL